MGSNKDLTVLLFSLLVLNRFEQFIKVAMTSLAIFIVDLNWQKFFFLSDKI